MIRPVLTSLALAAFLLAGLAASQASTYTWTGGADNLLWREANNWTPAEVPPIDSTIVFAGATPTEARVPDGETVSLAGLPTGNAYPYLAGTTQVWLNNGAAFTIHIDNQYTYWHTIKVQDAYDYVIETNRRLALLRDTHADAPHVVDVVSGGSLTVNNGISVQRFDPGTLRKTGDGTMYITGTVPDNNSIVNLDIRGGTLSVDRVDNRVATQPDNVNLGLTCSLAIRQGATFQYTGNGSESKSRSLFWDNGDAAIEITNVEANLTIDVTGGDLSSGGGVFTKKGPGTLTLATSGADIDFGKPVVVSSGTLALQADESKGVQFASSISGDGTIKTAGAGHVTLTTASTYIGGTTVEYGTLLVNNTSDSGTGSGPVVVKPNGTLGGTGTIAGDVTVNGGILAPGQSVGTLTLGGNLTFDALGFFDIDIQANGDGAGVADLVQMQAGLLTPGDATIRVNLNFKPDLGDSWTILQGEGDISGLFHPSVAMLSGGHYLDGWKWLEVGYGNSVFLTVVPEPGTWLLLLSALACGMLVRRRR